MTENELQMEQELQYEEELQLEEDEQPEEEVQLENDEQPKEQVQPEDDEQPEEELQPEYVLPFQITKEAALEKLIQQMEKSFFLSKDFLKNKVKMIPAYVPFWLLDISYEDHQIWKYKVDGNEVSKYAEMGGKIHLDQFSIDGVHDLEDVITCGLAPYDYSQLVPNSQIMPVEDVLQEDSVTVKCEIGKDEAENTASKMIQAAFNREMKKKLFYPKSVMLSSEPDFWIENSTLVLLPIWYCVFYGDDGEYVAYVNGQTGKVVYTLPASPKKTALAYAGYFGGITGSIFATMCWLYWYLLSRGGINEWTGLFALGVTYLPIMALLFYIAWESRWEGLNASMKYKGHLQKVNAEKNLTFLKKDLEKTLFETALTEVTVDELDSDCERDD